MKNGNIVGIEFYARASSGESLIYGYVVFIGFHKKLLFNIDACDTTIVRLIGNFGARGLTMRVLDTLLITPTAVLVKITLNSQQQLSSH